MNTFTPGPWHVAAYNDALYITSGRPPASSNDHPLNDSDRTVIAKMFIPDCGSREANAALIADAPAMLDALKDLLALAEQMVEALDSHYDCRSIDEIEFDGGLPDEITQARALIAKHGGGV